MARESECGRPDRPEWTVSATLRNQAGVHRVPSTGDRLTQVLLADAETAARSAMAERLNREAGLIVIGEVGAANEAIDRVVRRPPDVVLMDVNVPGLLWFDAIRRIGTVAPSVGCILQATDIGGRDVDQAVKAGARGCLSKHAPIRDVIAAIHKVASGGCYFSGEARFFVNQLPQSRTAVRSGTLTRREVEVLVFIARGLSKKRIATVMGLSVRTVGRHAENLMAKLDIHDRVSLARFAIREGYVEP